jgi:hypothetical protein
VIETYDGSFQHEKNLFVVYGDGKWKRLHTGSPLQHMKEGVMKNGRLSEKVPIVSSASKGIGGRHRAGHGP